MRIVTDDSPSTVLLKAERMFAHDWPHGGYVQRPLESKVACAKPAGCLKFGILTLLTFGLYLVYLATSRGMGSAAAEVAAYEQDGRTVVDLKASRADWQRTLEEWAREELA